MILTAYPCSRAAGTTRRRRVRALAEAEGVRVEAGYYVINRIGAPVGGGVSGAVEVQMLGIAKDEKIEPYSLTNEYVGNRLAAVLGLPVPPGTIAVTPAGDKMFVTLRYSAGGTSLPQVVPAELVQDRPRIAAGIVAFDVWIANWDRHANQIAYVRGLSGVSIIDHGRSLLTLPTGQGAAAVTAARDAPHLYAQSCLLPHVDKLAELEHWAGRIEAIPDALIGEICHSTAADLDLCTPADASALEDFLTHRKKRIMDYLRAEQAMLPRVTGWSTP